MTRRFPATADDCAFLCMEYHVRYPWGDVARGNGYTLVKARDERGTQRRRWYDDRGNFAGNSAMDACVLGGFMPHPVDPEEERAAVQDFMRRDQEA